MPIKNFAASITVGGALSSTFTSAVGGAKAQIDTLGKSISRLNSAKASIGAGKGLVDFAALKRAREGMRSADDALAKLKAQVKGSTAPTGELALKLGRAQVEAARAREKFDALRKTQLETVRAVHAATGSYRLNENTLAGITAASERAAARIALLRSAGERMTSVGDAFRKVGSDMMRFGTIVAGVTAGVIGGAYGLAKSFAEAGDDIAATANNLGLTTRALQQFRYIASQNNVETEAMDKALAKLSVRLAKTIDPTDSLNEELRKLRVGMSARELRRLGPEKAMVALAEAMERIEDPAKKLALVSALFGEKAGPRMVSVLEGGAEGLRKLAAEAVKVGYVMDESMIERAKTMDAAWKLAGAALKGVRNVVGNELAPIVTKTFEDFTGWVMANKDEIKLSAVEIGKWVQENGLPMLNAIKDIAVAGAKLAVAINTVVDGTVGWAAVIGAGFVGKLIQWGVALKPIWTGLAAVAGWAWRVSGGMGTIRAVMLAAGVAFGTVTAPVWAVVGALVAVGGAVAASVVYWDDLKWAVGESVDWIGEKIGTAVDWWKSKFEQLGAWLTEFWDGTIGKIKGAWDTVAGWFGDAAPTVTVRPGSSLAAGAMAAALTVPGSVSIPPPAGSAAASVVQSGAPVTINVQAAPGQDPRAIAAEIERIMRERERARMRGALND